MKKPLLKLILLLVVLVAVSNSEVKAQAHQKGDFILTPAIGLGNYGYYGGGYAFPVILNADWAVHDYVDVGPYVGFMINGSYFSILPGARANFNWWQLTDDKASKDLKSDVLDLYLSVGFGYEIFLTSGFNGFNRFRWNTNLGLRWYFKPNIALMGEFGATPVAPVNLGIAFKL